MDITNEQLFTLLTRAFNGRLITAPKRIFSKAEFYPKDKKKSSYLNRFLAKPQNGIPAANDQERESRIELIFATLKAAGVDLKKEIADIGNTSNVQANDGNSADVPNPQTPRGKKRKDVANTVANDPVNVANQDQGNVVNVANENTSNVVNVANQDQGNVVNVANNLVNVANQEDQHLLKYQQKCSVLETANTELTKKVESMEIIQQDNLRLQEENKRLLQEVDALKVQVESLQKTNIADNDQPLDLVQIQAEIESKVKQEILANQDLRTKDGTKKNAPTPKILGFRIIQTIQHVPAANGWKHYKVWYGLYDRMYRVYLGRGETIDYTAFEAKIREYCNRKNIPIPSDNTLAKPPKSLFDDNQLGTESNMPNPLNPLPNPSPNPIDVVTIPNVLTSIAENPMAPTQQDKHPQG